MLWGCLYSPRESENAHSRILVFLRPHTYTVPGRMQAGLFTGLPRRVLLGNLTTHSLGASPLQNASQAHEKHLVEARLSKKMRRAAPAGIIPSWAAVR